MSIRNFALAAAFVLPFAVASSAHAGRPITSGPVLVGIGEDLTCIAMNVGGKDISDIAVDVHRGETPGKESGTTCASETENGVCGVGYTANASGYRYCSLTMSGSTKSVRARLCNNDTGECSELR